MIEVAQLYLAKAEESLEGAESEFSTHRYNNCANRCYYACFQAAVSALMSNGIEPLRGEWGHAFAQAQFAGELLTRRKVYPAGLRGTLHDNLIPRVWADYEERQVSEVQASRALRRSREFLTAIRRR